MIVFALLQRLDRAEQKKKKLEKVILPADIDLNTKKLGLKCVKYAKYCILKYGGRPRRVRSKTKKSGENTQLA